MTRPYDPSEIDSLASHFARRNEPNVALGNAISTMLALPGLRGLWPMSSANENGNAMDISGQGRTLSYSGNPLYSYNDISPHIYMDGVGDYLYRLDEAGLDITGTESQQYYKGMTTGGWFWAEDDATRGMFEKWTGTGAQFAWLVYRQVTTKAIIGHISGNGSTFVQPVGLLGMDTGVWFHAILRFVPSVSADIYLNGVKTSVTTSVPASIFNSNAPMNLGVWGDLGAAGYWKGRASLFFLCASALSDSIVKNLYEQTRGLFGV